MKPLKVVQRIMDVFQGHTHIDYNLFRQLLQYLPSFNLANFLVQIDFCEKNEKKPEKVV